MSYKKSNKEYQYLESETLSEIQNDRLLPVTVQSNLPVNEK